MLSRRRTRLALIALLIPAALTLGACGGSGDDSAATTTAPSGTDGGSGTPSTTGGSDASGGSAGGDASGDFCERITALEGLDDGASNDEALASYRNVLEVAPDEVRPDLETLIQYFELAESAGRGDTEAIQQLAQVTSEYQTATERLVGYVNTNC